MGRRQFHTCEESQGGNFGKKRRATEKRSPIGPYFQLNSPNNFSVKLICCWSKSLCVIVLRLEKTLEDHVMKTNQLGSRVRIWTPERLEQWYADRRDFFSALLLARNSRFALASRSPRFGLYSSKIRKKFRLFCRLEKIYPLGTLTDVM